MVLISGLYGKTTSRAALVANLPLEGARISVPLLPRVANNAGLKCRVLRRPLSSINTLVLPCLLILDNNDAVVLTGIKDDAAAIILPETGGASDIALEALEQRYTGYCAYFNKVFSQTSDGQVIKTAAEGHWFWNTLKLSKTIYRDVLIASVLINLFALTSPLFMRNIYDRVVPNNAIDTMWAFGIAAIIIFSFDALMKLLRTHFLDIAGKKSDILLSSAIFAHVMQLRLEQAPGSVGSFAKNLQDFESIRDFIASSTMALLIDLPFVVLFLVVIYVVAGPLMFVPLCAALVILVVSLLARNRIDQAIQHTYQASAAKSGLLIEALAGLEIIRANRLEGSMQRRWEDSVGEISEWSNRSRMISTTATTLSGWVQQVNTIGMAIVGVYLISAGELTMGGLIAAIMLSGRAMAPMGQIAGLIPRYNQTKTAYEGVAKVMEMPGERTEGKKYISEHAISGGYHFDNVGLTFDGQQQPSLSGVSFDIEAGSTTAVIGRIGSGKTSMLRLMVGLYQPTEGMIMLDGLNIGQIDPAELRDAVAVVEQQPHLFSGSVRDNITAASPFATDTQLMRAVKLAGVDTFTANHEEGLDRQVGERGSKLSGGQRQCVAIARALLPNPPIIIMDEPTSAMDQETEKIFISKLAELAKDKTLIVFTQRLSLLDIADKIMVLNNGKLHKFEDKATMLGGKRG